MGVRTRRSEVKTALGPASRLSPVGGAVSVSAVASFCHFVFAVPLPIAILLGAVTSPTNAAAVFSVLRAVPLPSRIRASLEGLSLIHI